jgi:diadenosine tetraphosphate (Ap4A) HIT family hydrolase
VVPHVHFHVIPRWTHRPIGWLPGRYDESTELQTLAARLRTAHA